MEQQYTLELSETLNPALNLGGKSQGDTGGISMFELAMVCGSMAHPMLQFSTNSEGTALSIEWLQKYPL
jgi:hypothetical protein|tara:strand:- start:798 stop:1004 length:207 start_codon:yes stop_codon:yes gene_type:complete